MMVQMRIQICADAGGRAIAFHKQCGPSYVFVVGEQIALCDKCVGYPHESSALVLDMQGHLKWNRFS